MPKKKRGLAARVGRGKTDLNGSGSHDTSIRSRQYSLEANGLRHLSLQEEARNTERQNFWHSGLKLRHAQMKFVSAGEHYSNDPIAAKDGPLRTVVRTSEDGKDAPTFDPKTSMASLNIQTHSKSRACSVPQNESQNSAVSSHPVDEGEMKQGSMNHSNDESNTFIIDTQASAQDLRTARDLLPAAVPRSSASDTSDSSQEVILFRGRDRSQQRHANERLHSLSSDFPHKSSTTTNRRSARHLKLVSPTLSDVPLNRLPNSNFSSLEELRKRNDVISEAAINVRKVNKDKLMPKSSLTGAKRLTRSERMQSEDEILADYVNNVRENEDMENSSIEDTVDEPILRFPATEICKDEAVVHSGDERLERSFKFNTRSNWSENDLQDFDELEMSNEVLGPVSQILSKRSRPSGIQYLVVWEGCTVDDARWIPLSSLDMQGASEQIQAFEANAELTKQPFFSRDDTEDSSNLDRQAAVDMAGEFDDMLNLEDLMERKRNKMTDGQIARLLSKQEELGLGSDELLLFDGDGDTEYSEGDNVNLLHSKALFPGLAIKEQRRRLQKGLISSSPSAGVINQDPYGDFDVMDRERPSIRQKFKGSNRVAPFEFSDSDMEFEIRSAWEKDRLKKGAYKQERAEIRAQGLLCRKGKLDIQARYPEGMSIGNVKKEIEAFLNAENESVLSLTPMDKRERIVVHEIANVLNLKSKSVGGGRSRYPVLYKTSRTVGFNQDAIGDIEARLTKKRFLPRLDKRVKHGSKAPKDAFRRRGTGASGAAVSYRDGEIVGAAAPELGSENRGRAMLEKMGWSTGTALGASNNKGIMQPVIHIVKTTKAGLG